MDHESAADFGKGRQNKNEPLIEFRNVSKKFGSKVILQGVSFKVYQGDTFCIIGGSGTGKSVTLKILLGLIPVDEGEVLFAGQPISEMDEQELNKFRVNFGMVFQGSALFDSMSVFDNVAYPLVESNEYEDDEIEKIVHEKLDVVGLKDAADLFPADISGGMKKRIGLARAIAANPQVILYDEPTAGLDPANVNRIDKLIRHLQSKYKVTSVLVTHNMESVYRVASRVALLYDQKMAFMGSLEEFKNTSNSLVKKFVQGELGQE